MKAMRVTAYGSPDQLRLVELDDPVPGDNEVLIDVSAASVNPIDWKIVSGAMQAFIPLPLPFTPGVDAAGTVIAVGRSVTTLKPGDEVMGFIGIVGAFATRAVVEAARLARKPASLAFTDAAAIPAATLTAWQALHEHGALQAGQSVLIHGAAGGVGSAAVQLAKLAGAHVIGTGSAGNRDYLESLGADSFIDYRAEVFAERVSRIDLVLDLIGGETQERSWSVLKPGGKLVSTVARPSAALADAAQATGKHFATRADGSRLEKLAELHASGDLRTHIESVYALSDVGQALGHSKGGHVRGKIVVDVAQETRA
ncbi:NADPH:quinone reductase, Zinc-containing alcohol dehydrogenase superfamily [Cupriavidus taiwanensis]|uniref:NADP-dependent oxidoreductase n=1 Tax=Cupriavidus taiwanensis TaxID=164546 RepID=UPI000E139DD7|nr:NADP-dependent oxidoreductase [Cupriavidus taiwanensis]SPA33645.1 NADPH:quinone reductase, Zinc-containing alcohol dehydrogenase superfamily [Cupriavidus taiwanensis]